MDGMHVMTSSPNSPESHRETDQEFPQREDPHAVHDAEEITPYALPLILQSETHSIQDRDDSHLLRSFDMIFQLHQRSEELRAHLEKIDQILLSSRSVAPLTEKVIQILQHEFDLSAARILLREDHPIASTLLRADLPGVGTIPLEFLAYEDFAGTDPFVLDDPDGDLCQTLFATSASMVSSAVIANLTNQNKDLGLLCLGSEDPDRYCGGMNTHLISMLADKVSLGILNAWDHEKQARKTLFAYPHDVYSHLFFQEYLTKEFNRAWRTQIPFTVAAVSWKRRSGSELPSTHEVSEIFSANLRSADLLAVGDRVNLWLLLHDTDVTKAEAIAHRVCGLSGEYVADDLTLHVGITQFSRHAPVASTLLKHARQALHQAIQSDSHSVVVQVVPPISEP